MKPPSVFSSRTFITPTEARLPSPRPRPGNHHPALRLRAFACWIFHADGATPYGPLRVWIPSLRMFVVGQQGFVPFQGCMLFRCVGGPRGVHPHAHSQTPGSVSVVGFCKETYCEHGTHTFLCVQTLFSVLWGMFCLSPRCHLKSSKTMPLKTWQCTEGLPAPPSWDPENNNLCRTACQTPSN